MDALLADLRLDDKAGQLLLKMYLNWRTTNWKPTEDVGCLAHWKAHQCFQKLDLDAFRSDAKKVAAHVIFNLTEDDYLELVHGCQGSDLKWIMNSCSKQHSKKKDVGSAKKAKGAWKGEALQKTKNLAAFKIGTVGGNLVARDLMNPGKSGFCPRTAGSRGHYQSRPEYYKVVTYNAFSSQAKAIAREVLGCIPDQKRMEELRKRVNGTKQG